MHSYRNSRGAVVAWRQGSANAEQGTAAPRPRQRMQARGFGRVLTSNASRIEDGEDGALPLFVHHYRQQGIC